MNQGIWQRETVAALLVAAMLPIAFIWIWHEGASAISRLVFAALLLAIWQLIFMIARAQPPSLSLLVTGLAIAIHARTFLEERLHGLGVVWFRMAHRLESC